MILICDRGMVSRENIELLEREEFGYIFGVRLRKVKRIQEEVLSRGGRYREVADNLRVKEVELDGQRYIVCLNPEEERRDREVREQLVEALQAVKLELDGKSFLLRSDFEGVAHLCFMVAGVKPPPVITQM